MVTKLLVDWTNAFSEDATWEKFHDLQMKFPSFHPEDKDRLMQGN